MDDFSVFDSSVDDCLHKLEKVFPHGAVEIQIQLMGTLLKWMDKNWNILWKIMLMDSCLRQ